MVDRGPFDLDAALAELARAERALRPPVPPALRARVLAAAARAAARNASPRASRAAAPPPVRRSWSWRRWPLPSLLPADRWAGAAVALALLCFALGLGLGYRGGDLLGAGDAVAEAPLDADLAFLGAEGETFLIAEGGL